MKTLLKSIFFILLLFSTIGVNAQSISYSGPIPFKPMSPLFGKDIVINNAPSQNQRNVAVCSAFNGWLYAAYSYSQPDQGYISVLRSVDNGISWNYIGGGGATLDAGKIITNLGIIACGNSASSIKLFIGWVYIDTIMNFRAAYVCRYTSEPFTFEVDLFNESGIKDLVLSNDYSYPAHNSDPYSIGVLYSKSGSKDSIIFRSSGNGGLSLDNKQTIATSDYYFHKVSLNYGRSSSWSTGRYFAAWEEQTDQNANLGHIYTAHSEPYFNSPFSNPVCLDCLDTATINKVRDPVIACQYNNVDNDSTNISEVVIFEKYLSSNNRNDLKGFYNLQATTSNYFKELTVSSSSDNKIQPDLNFNPFNSTFIMTYFDSTEKKLQFLSNNVNLNEPNTWNLVSSGYNDSLNLGNPTPKVKINVQTQDGMNVWVAESSDGNGIAMFDAPYSTYTGVTENIFSRKEGFSVYPNPCKSNIIVDFELQKASNVTISIYNLVGQPAAMITNQNFSSGKHELKCSVNLLPGSYLCSYKTDDFSTTQKLMVIR